METVGAEEELAADYGEFIRIGVAVRIDIELGDGDPVRLKELIAVRIRGRKEQLAAKLHEATWRIDASGIGVGESRDRRSVGRIKRITTGAHRREVELSLKLAGPKWGRADSLVRECVTKWVDVEARHRRPVRHDIV